MNREFIENNMNNENMINSNNEAVDQIENGENGNSEKGKKRRKILLIILAVLLVLAIIFYFLFGTSKTETNEYKGTKDLEYIEQIMKDNEYYMFEEEGQKYILFQLETSVYKPQKIEIKSANIYGKSYTEDKKLELNINLETETTRQEQYNSNSLTVFNKDSMLFIQKVNTDCSGLIVNNIEYKKFEGGIIKNNETQKLGYIDSEGNIIIPTEYSNIEKMDDSYYNTETNNESKIDYSNYLKIYKDESGYGIASKEGKILIDCQYTTIINFDPYTFAVTKGDETNAEIGIVDLYGNIIQEFRSGGILDNSEEFDKFAIVTSNNKKGVIDRNLKEIIPTQYDSIIMRNFEEDNSEDSKYLFAVEKDGQYEVLDENGESVVNESLYTISKLFGKDMNSQEIQDIYSNILNNQINKKNNNN